MTIVTQDREFVNYQNIVKISTYVGYVDDVECYTILGLAYNSKDYEGDVENAIQLGLYANKEEAHNATQVLLDAIASNKNTVKMPDSEIFMLDETTSMKDESITSK
jgi:effector-binding domain-containing protein